MESRFNVGDTDREAKCLLEAGSLTAAALLMTVNRESPEAMIERATSWLDAGRLDEALAAFEMAASVAPDSALVWYQRGNALIVAQRVEDALASYERALALQPEFPDANNNRLAALFALGRAPRCPPSYIRRTFDQFSAHYDETMLNRLAYKGHIHLRELADATLPRRTRGWRILDLGCGTGLVGELFKDLARGGRLDGIDLSPRMIEAARRRGIYDDLRVADVEAVLHEAGPTYDLILAADTMSYFGDLGRVLAGVAARLEPDGFCLFAVESMPGEAWELTPRKLFRHSESYVRKAAGAAGLVVARLGELTGAWLQGSRQGSTDVLHQGKVPVTGLSVALRKPA
jgi:predicted TPR repeat methyltransferase